MQGVPRLLSRIVVSFKALSDLSFLETCARNSFSFRRNAFPLSPFSLLPPQGFWPKRAKKPRRHLRTPRVIERKKREWSVFPVGCIAGKKSRFDHLHVRKVSTFCPQMVIGGQQGDTRVKTCGIDVFATSFGLSSDLEFKRL